MQNLLCILVSSDTSQLGLVAKQIKHSLDTRQYIRTLSHFIKQMNDPCMALSGARRLCDECEPWSKNPTSFGANIFTKKHDGTLG
jgi:CRISPR/Cas system-associated protein Csm6